MKYDAWGNCTVCNSDGTPNTSSTFIGNINPFRYRGYYWDKELGLYYLHSRYYDPAICRFISLDDVDYLTPDTLGGLNLYSYCNNNPIMYADPSGCLAISTLILLLCVGAGAIAGGTYAGSVAYNSGMRDWELVGWTVAGAVAGAVVGGIVGYYTGPIAADLFSSGALAFAGGLGSTGLALSGSVAGTLVAVGALGLTTVGALTGSGFIMFAKTSRQSGKSTASNKPSWVNERMIDPSKSAQQNATDILNWKYGLGNWHKGPGTEFNKIVKWIERYLRYYRGW